VLQLKIEGHVFQILGLQPWLQELRRVERKLRDDFQIQSKHATALLLDLQLEGKSQERIQAM
jgi:hypothetical protein